MEYSILSDRGSRRKTNQDFAGTYTNQKGGRLFLLADGMGGHNAGDVASRLAVEDIGRLWNETVFVGGTDDTQIEAWMRRQVLVENENIANLGKLDDYVGMGTTLEMIFWGRASFISAHIGDSRTYLIRDGLLQQVTTDHSLVQELVEIGEITPEEANNHPNKNIITRSLGQAREAIPDVQNVPLRPGDMLLMNSDGLTNMVEPEAILGAVLADTSVESRAENLITLANAHGGLDNITVILIATARNGGSQP